MNIADMRENCKEILGKIPRDMLIIAILVLTSFAGFGLGYLAGREEPQGYAPTANCKGR